jgi:hypothetical protein
MQLETQTQSPPQNPFPETAPTDLIPLNIIRTETVLSKLPVHNLAKKGRVDIQITKLGPRGEVELKWEVSYSERYGQARQLAYKLDTIVVDQRIDEAGRPLPERVCLGSLNQIAQELGLIADHGTTNQHLKRAFRQNALAGITAKFRYKTNDGSERTLEATFTRYNVIFTGEKFSNGTRADAVYIELNPIYRDVLNNAPVRPLNLEYKKQLAPAPQRFYEIVSYKIFAALKYNQPFAKLPYSEYCTFSAQQRYFDYDHFKKQMYKIHRPHLQSGYITKAHYDHATDEEGRPDWIMCYVPGPKARAEYATFTGKKLRTVDAAAEKLGAGKREATPVGLAPAFNSAPTAEQPVVPETTTGQGEDDPLLEEMTKRGITEKPARKLLQNLADNQAVIDQLEWGDFLISQQPRQFKNPSGFYVYLIRENVIPPPSFEPSRLRHAREQQQLAETQRQNEHLRMETEYRDYKDHETERYIQQNVTETEINRLLGEKRKQLASQFKNFDLWSPENLRSVVWGAVKAEIAKRVPFLTFEAYREQQSQQLRLFLPTEQGTAVPAAPPQPDENALRQRYQDYCRKQAEAALDALDMMERGRRRRAARMYLLHEHPDKERFAHMIAEENFDEFHSHSQRWLIEQTCSELSLPAFEIWRQEHAPAR